MEFYNFYQQYKDYFTTAKATDQNRVYFRDIFLKA